MSAPTELGLLQAAWDAPPPSCEAVTATGACCKRPANWLLNLHGCERVLLCGQHLRRWEWMAHTTMDATCSTCGRVWPMQSDAYTASRI